MACRSVQRRPSWWRITSTASAVPSRSVAKNLKLFQASNTWEPSSLMRDPGLKYSLAQATGALANLKVIWKDKNIALSTKIRLLRSLIMSIFLYTCETWTLTAGTERKIQTMEMRSFRRLIGISYREHITNEEVRSRIRQAIGPYKELLTIVKQSKLQWYWHTTRSSGLAKTFLQGTVQGGRRRGRQRKRWEDNICEWTGLGLSDTVRKAEEWRRLVVTSCGAPTVHKMMGQIDR